MAGPVLSPGGGRREASAVKRAADVLAAGSVGGVLGAGAIAAGPLIAAGAVLGAALAAAIYRFPVVGLWLMIFSSTVLQVLGSEHLTGLPVSLGKVSGMVTLAAWGLRIALHRQPMTWSPQVAAFLVFFAAIWLAGFVSPDPGASREALVRYAQLFLLFFLIANIAGETEAMLDQAIIAFTAAMALSSLIGLAEYFLPSLSIESDDPALMQGSIGAVVDRDSLDGVEIKRITGGLSDSNWFSYALVSVLPFNLYLFHRFSGVSWRLLVVAVGALQSVCIMLSFTRSAVMALGLAVLVLVVRRRLPLVPLVLAGAVGLAGLVVWNPPGLQRLYSVEYVKAGSTPLRSVLLHGGVALIQERPVVGYGYNQYGANFVRWLHTEPVLDDVIQVWEREFLRRVAEGEEQVEWVMPHNTVIQVWVEFGLLGLLAFAGFVWAIMRDAGISRKVGTPHQALLADCLLAAVLAFLVCATFGHLLLLKVIWILGGIGAALCRVAVVGAGADRGSARG